MLVLSRKVQQQIQIGNNIVITILQVKGQQVRVGIEAPKDVKVMRSELPAADDLKSRGTKPSVPRTERNHAKADKANVTMFSSPQQVVTPRLGVSDPRGLGIVPVKNPHDANALSKGSPSAAPLLRTLDRLRPQLAEALAARHV